VQKDIKRKKLKLRVHLVDEQCVALGASVKVNLGISFDKGFSGAGLTFCDECLPLNETLGGHAGSLA